MTNRPPKTHAGLPLPENHVLFSEPPASIGEVVSARSTLMTGMATGPDETERAKAAFWKAVIGYVLAYIYFNWAWMFPVVGYPIYFLGSISPYLVYYGKELIALAFAAWGWFRASKNWEVTYVGKEGIAGFSFTDDVRTVKSSLSMHFKDAADLRTGQTRHYRNHRYEGTSYFFTWTDAAGKTLAEFGGWHQGMTGDPGAEDPFFFGRAAEMAWTEHLFHRSAEELAKAGKLVFKVSGNDWVAVGPEFLEVCFGGKPAARCTTAELESVSIQSGWFTIKRKDATVGWFSSEGIFKFPFSGIANARFFLFALDAIGKIKVN